VSVIVCIDGVDEVNYTIYSEGMVVIRIMIHYVIGGVFPFMHHCVVIGATAKVRGLPQML
jgi:hypothetical protein